MTELSVVIFVQHIFLGTHIFRNGLFGTKGLKNNCQYLRLPKNFKFFLKNIMDFLNV